MHDAAWFNMNYDLTLWRKAFILNKRYFRYNLRAVEHNTVQYIQCMFAAKVVWIKCGLGRDAWHYRIIRTLKVKKCVLGTPHYWFHMSMSCQTKTDFFSLFVEWFLEALICKMMLLFMCKKRSKDLRKTLTEWSGFSSTFLDLRLMLRPLMGVVIPGLRTLS